MLLRSRLRNYLSTIKNNIICGERVPTAVDMDPREKPLDRLFQHLVDRRGWQSSISLLKESLSGGCGLGNEHQTKETNSYWKQGCQNHGNQVSDLLCTYFLKSITVLLIRTRTQVAINMIQKDKLPL